ncbi:MerR family transcriptional regulator [Paenibacillus tengchongensis]|uniref:MerR family transcriptional regulator n=1 Tax=Paenibacillus tengchongensis TaxID=2608684 RepID=UPI00124EB8AF|nr:MerR family transcriptional regulator [Paenibacillus tengchongensis]
MVQYLSGELAKTAGINIETLRYYEKHGLLPEPERTASGYRLYTEETLLQLTMIHNAKRCGFTLREIRKALEKSAGEGIGISDFAEAIDRKLAAVDREIARREQTKQQLIELKRNIGLPDPHPGVVDTLQVLNVKHHCQGAAE